ncbi:MAG: hypothetical protein ACI9MC_001582 [Kiritimatiellia bacterium]|jgi:hypothetical protein
MLRTSIILLALALPVRAFAGEPILVPDFTPGTMTEFGLAAMLQERTELILNKQGHVVLTSEMVIPIVGELDPCADTVACPTQALQTLPARFGVVVKVRRQGAQVFADVMLHEQTSSKPLQVLVLEVIGGNEDAFARQVADMVDEMASVMGPASADDLVKAAMIVANFRSDEQFVQPPVAPPPKVDPVTVPDKLPEPPPPDPRPDPQPKPVVDGDLDSRLAGTDVLERHLIGSTQQFLNSGEDVRDWVFKARPHAGRTIIEVRGGVGIGDVDRVAVVRTQVDGANQIRWFMEGPVPGQAVRGELFVGYAPSTWVDLGVLVGLQYGKRTLDSGWSDTTGDGRQSEDLVQAVQFNIQPRLRLYPVRIGAAKPYIAVGVGLRVFDGWRIQEVQNVTYAQPPGGITGGPAGAVGLLIDPAPIVGIFVEGGIVKHMGLRAIHAQNDPSLRPTGAPAPQETTGYTIGVVGGVQFRL